MLLEEPDEQSGSPTAGAEGVGHIDPAQGSECSSSEKENVATKSGAGQMIPKKRSRCHSYNGSVE